MPKPSQNIEDVVFIAFDTETTGLFPIAGKLVELGAVKFRYGGQVLDTFSELIDPQSPIPPEVIRIHGITDEMVRGKPIVKEIIPKFIHFLGKSENVLLGHNASFDIGFVGVDIVRVGFEHPPHMIFDTLDLSRRCLPYLPNYKLETVAKALRISLSDYHRALSDSIVVKSIFEQLVKRNPQIHTLEKLFDTLKTLNFWQSSLKSTRDKAPLWQIFVSRRSHKPLIFLDSSCNALLPGSTPWDYTEPCVNIGLNPAACILATSGSVHPIIRI